MFLFRPDSELFFFVSVFSSSTSVIQLNESFARISLLTYEITAVCHFCVVQFKNQLRINGGIEGFVTDSTLKLKIYAIFGIQLIR